MRLDATRRWDPGQIQNFVGQCIQLYVLQCCSCPGIRSGRWAMGRVMEPSFFFGMIKTGIALGLEVNNHEEERGLALRE